MTIMQTILNRLSSFLESLFPPRPTLVKVAATEPETDRWREQQRLTRDESYYWAMNGHW
jgi:hypothetical protein